MTPMKKVAEALLAAPFWRILSHVKPDGDTLGSASALFSAARSLGKKVEWGGADEFPSLYRFLPHSEEYHCYSVLPRDSAALIILDTSTIDRSVPGLAQEKVLVNIDHHPDNSEYGIFNWIDPSSSSVGEMIYQLLRELNCNIDRDIAYSLYISLSTDTGGFRFSNTTSRTLRTAADLLDGGASAVEVDEALHRHDSIAKLQIWGVSLARTERIGKRAVLSWSTLADIRQACGVDDDTEGLVNLLTHVDGADIVVLIVEAEGVLRCSVRSRGDCSSQSFAAQWGGGGHKYAAGCRLFMPLEQGITVMREALSRV